MGRPTVMFNQFARRDAFSTEVWAHHRGYWPAFIRRRLGGIGVLPVDPDLPMDYRRVSCRLVGSGGRS
jgi:hypothetical protein